MPGVEEPEHKTKVDVGRVFEGDPSTWKARAVAECTCRWRRTWEARGPTSVGLGAWAAMQANRHRKGYDIPGDHPTDA